MMLGVVAAVAVRCHRVQEGDAQSTESTGIEEGTLIGVIVAAVVVAVILLAGVCCLVAREKAGKPLFTNLDVKPDP